MITAAEQCTIAILAGGKSNRFPPNKLLIAWKGKPLIQHTISNILRTPHRLSLITNQKDDFSFLGLPTYSDIYANKGPLGGIHAALRHAKTPVIWVIAGDMIYMDESILGLLFQYSGGVDCVIPENNKGQPEPLCGLYRTSCLQVIEQIIDANRNPSVLSLFENIPTRYISWNRIAAMGIRPNIFTNINSPRDLEKI